MPNIIQSGSGASFNTVGPVPTPDPEVTVNISEPKDGDSVDLSNEPPGGPSTYGPAQFSDRFKFDIQNGMLDASLRFDARTNRSRGADVKAYAERQGVDFQITKAAGIGSQTSALFALQFQDVNPNATSASTQVEGRLGFSRVAEQSLNLLASL